MAPTVRTLIVDDEAVARMSLRAMLADVDWVSPIEEARDGGEAIDAMRAFKPDLVFLDIELPVCSGVEALERSGTSPAVIFTTAHDDAAITAFELGAIDYLRKPFGQERFSLALERARVQLATQEAVRSGDTPAALQRLAQLRNASRPLTRVFVRDKRTVIPVDTQRITRCAAAGDYVTIYADGAAHQAYMNLRDLALELDPARFVRVHRSHLVNLDFVASLTQHDPNRLEVLMKDGTRITASRAGTQALRAQMRSRP
jgi:two-component system, LytTR family, response regulator